MSTHSRPRSLKQAQLLLTAELRAQGQTWVEVADEFRRRYRVNTRVAFRQAHGWSQRQAAEHWTARWPDDPKTFKNFSYWETWPSRTGHAPSLDVLDKLAQLYECSVADLLADGADYGTQDVVRARQHEEDVGTSRASRQPGPAAPQSPHGRRPRAADSAEPPGRQYPAERRAGERLPGGGTPPGSRPETDAQETTVRGVLPRLLAGEGPRHSGSLLDTPDAELLDWARRLRGVDFRELTRVVVDEAQQLTSGANRRAILFRLSNAFAVAAAAPLFEIADPDERRRARHVSEQPHQLDEVTLNHTETVLHNFRRQADVLGPRSALQTALEQREVLTTLARNAPRQLRPRTLSLYADMTQLVGWLMYDLGDHRAAQHYYDDAREAGHDADDPELVSYVLCTSAQLAHSRGRPRLGIDHAEAARHWASRADSGHAQAYSADVAARMYAAAGMGQQCRAALDSERDRLASLTEAAQRPSASWWYFYDTSFYWGTEAECALRLDMPVDAWDAASSSLRLIDQTNLHDRAMTLTFHAEALILQREVEQAGRVLIEVVRLAGINSSVRISERVGELRSRLEPWREHPVVQELDEHLALHRTSHHPA